MSAPTSKIFAGVRALSVALVFCIAMGAAVAEARFRVMTAVELRFVGSLLRHGSNEFRARMLPLAVFGICLGLALWLLYRFALRRFATVNLALSCAVVSLILVAQQTHTVREARGQRMAFLRTMHRIEGAAAPGETVIVGNPDLLRQLRWYAGDGFRQQLLDRVTERSGMPSEEVLFVGRRGEKAGRELTDAGFMLREVEATTEVAETLGRFAGEGTRMYFVTFVSAGSSPQ